MELGLEGPDDKVSRRQAFLALGPSGEFTITNAGARTCRVALR